MTAPAEEGARKLLTPGEVAAMFRVDPKTVARYARQGRLPSVRTPGGQHRFYEDEMRAILDGSREEPGPGDVPSQDRGAA